MEYESKAVKIDECEKHGTTLHYKENGECVICSDEDD